MFRNLYVAQWTKDYVGEKYLKMFLAAWYVNLEFLDV